MDERNNIKFKYLYFILEVGVVFIHAYNLEVYGITENAEWGGRILYLFETFSYNVLTGICVQFFFFISGYHFFRNYSWEKVWVKYRSRIKSLLFPYLLWNTFYFIVYCGLTHIPVIALHMNMEPLKLSMPYYLSCLWGPIDAPLWFVKNLMFSVLLSPLFFVFISRKKSKIWKLFSLLGSIFLLSFALFYEMDMLPFDMPLPVINIYFLVGGIMGIYGRRFIENVNKKKVYFGGLLVCIGLVLEPWAYGSKAHVIWVMGLIAGAWFWFDTFTYSRQPKWWVEQSFFIYCAHSLLLEGLEKLWLLVGGRTLLAATLDYILMPIISIIILCVAAIILNKICGPVYFVMTGGRSNRS